MNDSSPTHRAGNDTDDYTNSMNKISINGDRSPQMPQSKGNMKETLEEHQRNVAALRMVQSPTSGKNMPGNPAQHIQNNVRLGP